MNNVRNPHREPQTVIVNKTYRLPSVFYLSLGILVHIWFIGHEFAVMSLWSPVIIFLWPFYLIIKFFGWFFTVAIFWVIGIVLVCVAGVWAVSRWDDYKRTRARRRALEQGRITQL